MKECNVKVWLPEGQFCNGYDDETCQFFNGIGFCLLLRDAMASSNNNYIKLPECPSWEKYKK